ncbi:hypothetical protein JQ557_31425 [Bradyrhizobium sp. U87765 SZCCT0131]|uniref:hypothetical protein n=1 Tax=unclassified Bradyrhizobium TaxID=2631580 RepID=UPI001BA554A2|nr:MULTISPECIES: hypothetical protein [unclassified Bradyrhizobium]MBR1222546.1 hypothetical protein [Bradyrhizobium sp. U87765 SZCCT0131]MBR1265373.1 hypothetical protein [Bradyrhizobium sp. U87765 SZCCT0134]MBR1302848.1 hypothetical protein [Bradyrhizobium sp. U87765 SZCCT0110]MBR1323546.1 hypothetical protein [Bradyrhizobium sp. U87765 SZCCT0109]MBR1346777.1 hypothetical protein [Bradyrhizobium sp. U87765 SZCCT0048]
MTDLYDWLVGQHPGLRTYASLQRKALELASTDAEHGALYHLLAGLAGRHIESYDEEPLPADVAQQAYQRLLTTVGDAERSIRLPPSEQVKALNRLAATELV